MKTHSAQLVTITCLVTLALLISTFNTALAHTKLEASEATIANALPAFSVKSGLASPLQQATPVLVARKTWTLYADADGNYVPSPGGAIVTVDIDVKERTNG